MIQRKEMIRLFDKGTEFHGYVSHDEIQQKCENIVNGSTKKAIFTNVVFVSQAEPESFVVLPVKITSVQIDGESIDQVTKFLLQTLLDQGILPWQALLSYNRAFLRGELFGTFYHGAPLYPDQNSETLHELNRIIFTIDGQGRDDEITRIKPEKYVKLLPIIKADRPVTYVGNEALLKEINEEKTYRTFQKEYLDALVSFEDDTVQKLLALREDPDVYFAIWDTTGNLLGNGPEKDDVTFVEINGVSEGGDTSTGSNTKEFRQRRLKWMLRSIQKYMKDDLPELGYLKVWEREFHQTGPTLPEKLLKLLRAR